MRFAPFFVVALPLPPSERLDLRVADGGEEIHRVINQAEYLYAVSFFNFEFAVLLRACVHVFVPLLEWAFVVACGGAAYAFLVFVAVAWDAVYSARCDFFFFVC